MICEKPIRNSWKHTMLIFLHWNTRCDFVLQKSLSFLVLALFHLLLLTIDLVCSRPKGDRELLSNRHWVCPRYDGESEVKASMELLATGLAVADCRDEHPRHRREFQWFLHHLVGWYEFIRVLRSFEQASQGQQCGDYH